MSAAYLINHTPNWFLDFKTPLDVLGDHISPLSLYTRRTRTLIRFQSRKQIGTIKTLLDVLFMLMSTLINGVHLIIVLFDVSLLITLLLIRVISVIHLPRRCIFLYFVYPSSPIQGEMSELESLRLGNL